MVSRRNEGAAMSIATKLNVFLHRQYFRYRARQCMRLACEIIEIGADSNDPIGQHLNDAKDALYLASQAFSQLGEEQP